MTPKIKDRPMARRNTSAPYETPLKRWVSQTVMGGFPAAACTTSFSQDPRL
jgi:hypothetical protein